MKTLLMTCCVRPATPITRNDPTTRLLDCRSALALWLTEPGAYGRIIVADGSWSQIVTPALRAIAIYSRIALDEFPCDVSGESARGGKSAGEAAILSQVAESGILDGEFTKVTGRLFVKNARAVEMTTGPAIGLHRPGYADTRFFRTTTDFIREEITPRLGEIHDWQEERHIESIMGKFDFPALPVSPQYYGALSNNYTYP